MESINSLLGKYQKLESLFMCKEITEFKATLEKFKTEQIQIRNTLSAMNNKGQNTAQIKQIDQIIGSGF
jgi:protein subunit release factor A